MKITSSAFGHDQKIPGKYTCDGDNVNPPLQFSDVPPDSKSLVLIVDDPDAPSKTWVHWVVYNIDSDTSEVEEDTIPSGGLEATTDFGRPGYGGNCPPSGTHRYFFRLYALDCALELPKNATKEMVEKKMQHHTLDKAELIGLYSGV
ncbi:MAG: phosphatidylethanolamine-binding protein [Candidatus Levybacteria bacterium RIFCSPHIGHO2_01_FULL_38_26]|nr:MAG: phosphatidylethanolamine-binding protein [Candidatus Levybacteria bacterium RIFCSPHIGHO2_01_FULL_38_26]